jgi:O-succinylbenzoate synthase
MKARAPLNRKSAAQEVEGFLLRIDGGFSCVQPWPIFGHPSLEEHWRALQENRSLPLLEQAFACAAADAAARQRGESWWSEVVVPRSHATITDLTEDQSPETMARFSHAKIKASIADTELIHQWALRFPHLRLRLDFNEVPGESDFVDWWEKCPQALRERVDWIEDPFPYEASRWHEVQAATACAFACDRAVESLREDAAVIAVWKPAWQSRPADVATEKIIVTSAMDHPVGQAWAAYSAGRAGVTSIAGLRTDALFERDAFSELMGAWSPEWPSLGGSGMGFDDILESLPWTRIF